jgi:hypothetical protein
MKKIANLKIIFSLLLFSNCEQNKLSESTSSTFIEYFHHFNELKKSHLKKYIDFNREYLIINELCLETLEIGFNDILWPKDSKNVVFGLFFNPLRAKNKRHGGVIGKQEYYFVLKVCESNGTDYCEYHIFFYTSAFEFFIPCTLKEDNILYVDTIFDIVPNYSLMEDNCIFKNTGKHKMYGIFEEIDSIR